MIEAAPNAWTAVVCQDCDAAQAVSEQAPRPRAVCFRCGALLVRAGRDYGRAGRDGFDRLGRTLALTLGAIPLFVAANGFPVVRLEGAGAPTEATVPGAVRALWNQDLPALAALVLLTTIVLPALQLVAATTSLLWLRSLSSRASSSLSVRASSGGATGAARLSRIVDAMRPWTQIEILLLGILVAFGKLATVFHVAPGIGLWCMVGYLALERGARASSAEVPQRRRARDSLARTSAYLIAAAVLFVPANLLPVMTTRTLLRSHSDTILSGVVALWRSGSWPLAVLVFAASIVVPALKIMALALLAVSTHVGSDWRRGERTRLYRLVESLGRWSMLDIFVMALLAALVRSQVAGVEIHAGAIAFASVVVLTMLSSLSFDPRLIWRREKGQP